MWGQDGADGVVPLERLAEQSPWPGMVTTRAEAEKMAAEDKEYREGTGGVGWRERLCNLSEDLSCSRN